jgi:hypothetical protein
MYAQTVDETVHQYTAGQISASLPALLSAYEEQRGEFLVATQRSRDTLLDRARVMGSRARLNEAGHDRLDVCQDLKRAMAATCPVTTVVLSVAIQPRSAGKNRSGLRAIRDSCASGA